MFFLPVRVRRKGNGMHCRINRTPLRCLIAPVVLIGIAMTPIRWASAQSTTILDMAGVEFEPQQFHGRSFAPIMGESSPEGWNEMYAAHNFHELTMYYPMRVIRDGDLKLIWNIAYRLEYPFASDLWASSTWQSVHRSKSPKFGKRKVKDYLFRAEFELYDLSTDPQELTNLATHEDYAQRLESLKHKLKAFQLKTKDPWQIAWDNETQVQGTGVGL